MIKVTHIINAKLRGAPAGKLRGTKTHVVKVEITGPDALARVADGAAAGNPQLAEKIRRAKKFTMTLTPEKWAAMNKGATA